MHGKSYGRGMLAMMGIATALLSLGGCAIINHLLYVTQGAKIPAEFDGLKGKRVAVVCVSPNDDFGPGSTSVDLSRGVETLLRERVKDIKIVRHEEVANWIDRNNWRHDYLDIGRGVKADMVVAVDLAHFSLYEGSTLFQGRADLQVSVFDMSTGGTKVYQATLDDFSFPARGAQPVTDISEAKFKRAFVAILAQNIGRNFYDYDIQENIAPDAASLTR
ncbi:MAG: hypothetical protein KY475_01730 [Planctomycetes bacterium]|nr:hypothetical protein [Planctomycetota bacterium]